MSAAKSGNDRTALMLIPGFHFVHPGYACLPCDANPAAGHAPPPPRFARCASSSGPPPPLSRGRKVFPDFASSEPLTLHIKGRRSADRRNCPRSTPRHADVRHRLSAFGAWARLRARTPTGAPPRHLWQRTNATAQLQPALPGTWRHRVLPASGLSIQSSGLPRSTGRSAGRAYPPKPPECGVQIRPREPHSPRIQVCLENTSL
jgi:hypothetical protein